MQQLTLSFPAEAQCGYCACRLTLQPAGDWACDHCRPRLAEISGPTGWELFHIAARSGRYRKDCR